MIYLFCGSDNSKVSLKYFSVLNHLKNKRGGVSVYKFGFDNFNFAGVKDLLDQNSLFESKYILVWQNLLSGQKVTADFESGVKDLLESAKESPHVVLWQEGNLTAKLRKELGKFCEKVEEFDLKKEIVAEKRPDLFLLTDYLGNQNKQQAWIYLNELWQKNMAADEMLGPLVYFMKTLVLVGSLKAGETADLKPFVLGKYKKFSQQIGASKIRQKYTELLDLIAEARTISVPLSTKLEGWVLGW